MPFPLVIMPLTSDLALSDLLLRLILDWLQWLLSQRRLILNRGEHSRGTPPFGFHASADAQDLSTDGVISAGLAAAILSPIDRFKAMILAVYMKRSSRSLRST